MLPLPFEPFWSQLTEQWPPSSHRIETLLSDSLSAELTDWRGVSPDWMLSLTQSALEERRLRSGCNTPPFVLKPLPHPIEGVIHYGLGETPFGEAWLANVDEGICYLGWPASAAVAYEDLTRRWPNATLRRDDAMARAQLAPLFSNPSLKTVTLALHTTSFQLRVLEALLTIPWGGLRRYGDIAQQIGSPRAAQAVGQAVGRNPIAWLIPCHRIIGSAGSLGGYHWGTARKAAMLAWEGIE